MYYPYYVFHQGLISDILKPFHICSIDACVNRFRPISHFFSFIDANLIKIFPFIGFRSVTFLVTSFGCEYLIYKIIKKYYLKEACISLFIASLFIVSSFLLTANLVNFRPAKILSSFTLIYCIYAAHKVKLSNFELFFILILGFTDEISFGLVTITLGYLIYLNRREKQIFWKYFSFLLINVLVFTAFSSFIFSLLYPNISMTFINPGQLALADLSLSYFPNIVFPWISESLLNAFYLNDYFYSVDTIIINLILAILILIFIATTNILLSDIKYLYYIFFISLIIIYSVLGIKHPPILERGSSIIAYYSLSLMVFIKIVAIFSIAKLFNLRLYRLAIPLTVVMLLMSIFSFSVYSKLYDEYAYDNLLVTEYSADFWSSAKYIKRIYKDISYRQKDKESPQMKNFVEGFIER